MIAPICKNTALYLKAASNKHVLRTMTAGLKIVTLSLVNVFSAQSPLNVVLDTVVSQLLINNALTLAIQATTVLNSANHAVTHTSALRQNASQTTLATQFAKHAKVIIFALNSLRNVTKL
jgi:hypothetical protein